MAIPTARVRIEVTRLLSVPAAVMPAGHTRYARARVFAGATREVRSGRSRPLPDAGGDFDLTAESAPWIFEFDVEPGTNIPLTVELHEDHGDASPPAPTRISGAVNDPWTDGLLTFGVATRCEYRVTRTLINAVDAAFLARATAASGASGTLTVPQHIVVQFEDIAGLYKPDPAAVPPNPGARHSLGYASEDNLGRIFTNRDPAGAWNSGLHCIDAQVRVTATGGCVIPAAAKIRWTVEEPDDPTNEGSDFHREWGRYVDANDYDGGGAPLGAHPGDNLKAFSPGNADPLALFGPAANGSATARWAQAGGGPALSATSAAEAQTDITGAGTANGTSAVRIHCPSVLGTTLRIRAELTGGPQGIPVHDAATGVMTMWCRLDVEVARMAGAHSLSGALPSIPPFFTPLCVQMDMQTQHEVSGALDKAEMAASNDLLSAGTGAWVSDAAVFSHAGQGGWFFLGAARFPCPLPAGGAPPPLYSGTTYTLGTAGAQCWVEVPGGFANANYVTFSWTDASGRANTAGFMVGSATVTGAATRIVLSGNDVTPRFAGHDADGSIAHAYATRILFFPQHQQAPGAAALAAGGFGVPDAGATVVVHQPGAVYTTGISPSVPNASSGAGSYFAGRTVLFTHTSKFSTVATPPARRPDFDNQVLSTAVHEFLHAFGMPHKCGQWDWRTPRQRTCCMNYFNTWLIDGADRLIPGTVALQGNNMCGRHLMEVRRVHLDRNPGLNW